MTEEEQDYRGKIQRWVAAEWAKVRHKEHYLWEETTKMATELTGVTFNGTVTYFHEDGSFDRNANVNINDGNIQITEPTAVQQAKWDRGVKQDDGTVHVMGELYRKNNEQVSEGKSEKIEVIFDTKTDNDHPNGKAGYTFDVGSDAELAKITVVVDKLETEP